MSHPGPEAKEIDFARLEVRSTPFPHAIVGSFFKPDLGPALLDWFESDAPWRLVETDFYEQYEFDVADTKVANGLGWLKDSRVLRHLRSTVESAFSIALAERVDITAHMLLPGQRIRLHNDFVPGQETNRIVVQLNRGWADDDGGILMLFDGEEPECVRTLIRPINNSALVFAISPHSNHAVSKIFHGERYTLVYSFYAKRIRE